MEMKLSEVCAKSERERERERESRIVLSGTYFNALDLRNISSTKEKLLKWRQ